MTGSPRPLSRRRFVVGLVAVAGCASTSGLEPPPATTATEADPPPTEPVIDADPDPTITTGSTEAAEPAVAWAPQLASAPFALGVASGLGSSGDVLITTRVLDDPAGPMPSESEITLGWEVATDPGFLAVVAAGQVISRRDDGHAVTVTVADLPPADEFVYYRFERTDRPGDQRSVIGRTRVPPAPDATRPVRLAVASCQRRGDASYAAHRHLARRDLDAVIFLGDAVYADNAGDLDGFRSLHALYRSDPDLQACLAAHPWIAIRDDNDIANNWGPDSPRRAAGEQAFAEHYPSPTAGDAGTGDLRRRVSFGATAELFLVDVRPHRSPRAGQAAFGGSVVVDEAVLDPARTMLGADQESWLAEALSSSTADWQIVGSQVMVGSLALDLGGDRLINNDQWDGYPAARDRLAESLGQATSPVVLAGDLHSGIIDVVRTAAGNAAATEIVTPSISSTLDPLRALAIDAAGTASTDIVHTEAGANGWVELDIDADRCVATMFVLVDPSDPDSGVREATSARIARGDREPQVTS